ncbi:RIB43A-like with coiled-coils protein 1 [Genypterus blacodes]|uniref:RIB43A-like with coiled-coils protein 1 n=1 Tax=Genypterus blacodes TaxID=154954 RepID=UPI003F770ABC
MHKVDFTVEPSDDAAVARRRVAEAQRKVRIFNDRVRTIGLDLQGLDKQVREKKQLQDTQRQKDNDYNEMSRRNNEQVMQLARDEKTRREDEYVALTEFWDSQPRVEEYRDGDPRYELQGAFAIPIPESQLGASSMKIFVGEDLGAAERTREQMRQTERILREQRECDEKRQMTEKHREMLEGQVTMHQDQQVSQLQALEDEWKKAERMALDNYNLALAAQLAERQDLQRRREEEQDLAEVRYAVTSDMLTERPEAAVRAVPSGKPARVIVDRWRGMVPDELRTIRREQEAQRREKKRESEAEKFQDTAWDLQQLEISNEVTDLRLREESLRREERLEMVQRNLQLADQQRTHQEYLDNRVYTNNPTEDYFSQFNTTSR